MAWNDTTPCTFCGREVPFYKRFGDGRFCSKAHQDAALEQQNQLAVEMLHRTHDALKAYRPTSSSIEDILGAGANTASPPQWPSVAVEEPVQQPPRYEAVYQAPAKPADTHFGETVIQLQDYGFLASLRRLWESLTARRNF